MGSAPRERFPLTPAPLADSLSPCRATPTAAEEVAFAAFAQRFGRRYASPAERAHRLALFAAQSRSIAAHNARHARGETGSWQAVNRFSDLSADEWRAQTQGRVPRAAPRGEAESLSSELLESMSALPASVNWTAGAGPKGIRADVGVKDQAQCGSCWAFATVGAVEGAWATAGNALTSLSEQQIVSCDKKGGNAGCNGGEQITAMDWIAKDTKGLCTENEYPYTSGTGKDGKCETTCTPAVAIKKGVELPARNESVLMGAIAMTPLSLSVDASDDKIWQSYSGGVGGSITTNPEPRPRRRTLTINFDTPRQPRFRRPNHNPHSHRVVPLQQGQLPRPRRDGHRLRHERPDGLLPHQELVGHRLGHVGLHPARPRPQVRARGAVWSDHR